MVTSEEIKDSLERAVKTKKQEDLDKLNALALRYFIHMMNELKELEDKEAFGRKVDEICASIYLFVTVEENGPDEDFWINDEVIKLFDSVSERIGLEDIGRLIEKAEEILEKYASGEVI